MNTQTIAFWTTPESELSQPSSNKTYQNPSHKILHKLGKLHLFMFICLCQEFHGLWKKCTRRYPCVHKEVSLLYLGRIEMFFPIYATSNTVMLTIYSAIASFGKERQLLWSNNCITCKNVTGTLIPPVLYAIQGEKNHPNMFRGE